MPLFVHVYINKHSLIVSEKKVQLEKVLFFFHEIQLTIIVASQLPTHDLKKSDL